MRILILVAALALSGCASFATPQRCEQAAAGLATIGQLTQVFIDQGIEAAKAHKLADAVLTGQLLLAVACAQATPVSP